MRDGLPPEKLRRTFDPKELNFDSTECLQPLEGIIGQSRAVRALHFGLDIQTHGFNIYVAGPSGTGKMTAVRAFLEELAKEKPAPPDWCYLNNFSDPYRPLALTLPSGKARELRQDMKALIERARRDIPRAFESEEYTARREEIGEALNKQRSALFTQLSHKAEEQGLSLQATPMGTFLIPLVQGRPITEQEFLALPQATREELQGKRDALQGELREAMKEVRSLEKASHQRLHEMDREVALYVVDGLQEDPQEKYRGFPKVMEYLAAMREDIAQNLEQFRPQPPAQAEAPAQPPWMQELAFHKYEVNVVVDNAGAKGAPVIIELNPTYNNLFGRVEKETLYGTLHTDLTLIRGGSLHQANGGYLVVRVEELLRTPLAYEGLKRALREQAVAMEEVGELLGFLTTKSLRPEPIPLDVKVVLVGPLTYYHLLYALDRDFSELFKVKADFDERMDRTPENVQDYVALLCTLCRKEGLRHLDAEAVARIIEEGSRLAGDQQKLSIHMAEIADVLREANYWAVQEGSALIKSPHVQKAIEEKIYRSNLIQERIQEMIQRQTILIDFQGAEVGQVNGLSVISLGDYTFGRPNRITASVGMGQAGVMDIERQARLGGPIHTKGVLILSGYLNRKYAQDKPLALSARLVFEQSYEGVEGDSASSTELYALLSALSGLPIRQGIAVTGSVNQQGEVQAIGGVNQKIEGFYDVCKARGLTGEEGVIIPESNVQNLMLRQDVVEAVRQGKFRIWPVRTVDEGIEMLTGVAAGERRKNGSFPRGTVNYLVDSKLRRLAEQFKKFARAPREGEGPEGDEAQEQTAP